MASFQVKILLEGEGANNVFMYILLSVCRILNKSSKPQLMHALSGASTHFDYTEHYFYICIAE